MILNRRKQNIVLFVTISVIYVTLMASIYFMHLGNYSLRTVSFILILAVSVFMPSDRLPIIISLLFPLTEIVRLSDDSRTVLPFVVMIYILKAFSIKMIKKPNFFFFMMPFGLFVAMNIISSLSNFNTFMNPIVTCAFIFFAYVLANQKKDDTINAWIAGVFVVSSLITAVASIVYEDLSIEISGVSVYNTRMAGFSSPWNFGLCMLLAWFFTSMLFKNRNIGYVLMIAGSAAFVSFAIKSGTRSLLIGMCIVLFYIIFSFGRRLIKNKFVYFSIFAVIIPLGVIFYYLMIFKPLVESRGQFYDTSRVELWSYYLDLFSNNPAVMLFGLGCNNLSLYAYNTGMLTAHNIFIEMIVELGVVGTVFFVYLIAVLFAGAQKNPFKNDMIIPIILYCTFLMTQSGLSTELLYFLIALACQTYPKTKTMCAENRLAVNKIKA